MNDLLSRYKRIDLCLFVGLIVIAVGITYFYINHEQYFYFWDYTHYSDRVRQLAAKLQISPLKAVENFVDYLGDDYTQIPSLLLLPFSLLFGNSRLVFVLSLVLVYLVPFCLILGALATYLFQGNNRSRFIFWTTTYLTLFIPMTWVSILRGYPDLGGASIMTLALLYYWQNAQLSQRKQIIRLAGLFAIAGWFRRPFVYGFRAFFVTLLIQYIFNYYLSEKNKSDLVNLKKNMFKLIQIGIWFVIFSPVLVFKILFVDYRTLYASYELTASEGFQYYTSEFGGLIISLSCLGYGLGLFVFKKKIKHLSFFFVLGSLSIIQWIFLAKQNASHYSTHFISFFVIGLILLGLILKTTVQKRAKVLAPLFVLGFILSNMLASLTNLGREIYLLKPLFSANYPPLYRTDYKEVGNMVNFLNKNASENQFIYVAASSQILTSDALLAAEQQIFHQNQLKVLRTSNIDSRDVYPLNALMKSHFVVVASPVQYHLKPQEQKVVKTVVDIFQKQELFAKDFKLISSEFTLENGVKTRIYERFQETSFPVVLTTLKQMRDKIDRQPGRESYWLSLQSEQPSNIERDITRTVQLRDINLQQSQPSSFLYFGPISSSLSLTARLNTKHCQNSNKLALSLSILDAQGKVLSSQAWSNTKSNDIQIHVKSLPQLTAYLYLDIQRLKPIPSEQDHKQCSIDVNNILISK